MLTHAATGRGLYRTIYFVPTMVPTVAAALAFVFLLNPGGPLDTVLGWFGIKSPLWFQSPTWSKPGLVLLGLWGVGQVMIIFLAALLDVPAQLYESADIEGAGVWQKFRHITLPMISPVIFFSAVISVIYGFQYFTEAYVAATSAGGAGNLTNNLGYPQNSTLFYGIWLYEQAFDVVPLRLRVGDGLGAVRHHHGLHARADQELQPLGLLPGRLPLDGADDAEPQPDGMGHSRRPRPRTRSGSKPPAVRRQELPDDRRRSTRSPSSSRSCS